VVADLDADRDADIIVIRNTRPHQVLINDRAWQYHQATGFDRFLDAPISAATAGDLDADGRLELYTSGPDGLSVWTRTASGTWEARPTPRTDALANAGQLAIADVDGDGRLELIATSVDGRWQAIALSSDGAATTVFASDDPSIAGWVVVNLDAARGP